MSETCPGCALVLAPVSTPTHPYIGASPSCWALYGEQLAREYEQWDPEEHRRLETPRPNGTVTVRDVLAGTSIRGWEEDVWAAWSAHHEQVRRWAS